MRWWIGAGLLLALFALALSGAASAGTTLPGGTLANDTTWDLAGSPYTLDGDVIVPPGVTLTIDGGVEVGWNLTYVLQVEGGLVVNGTTAAPVSIYATGSSFNPHWVGILFAGHTIDSVVRNATLDTALVALNVSGPAASLLIENVVVSSFSGFGYHGLWVDGAASNVVVRGLHTQRIQDGAVVRNSTGLELSGVTASNLGVAGAYGLAMVNVTQTTVANPSFTMARLMLSSVTDVTVSQAVLSTSTVYEAVQVFNSVNVTITGARVVGGLRAFALTNVSGVTVQGTTTSGATGPANGAVRIVSSTAVRILDLSDTGSTMVIGVFSSPGTLLRNITATGAAQGLTFTFSPSFVVDGANLNASALGIRVQAGCEGGRIANASITTGGFGFDTGLSANFPTTDLDLSTGNSVNGYPVLGLYQQPGAGVSGATTYGFVYVHGSPGASVSGVRLSASARNHPAAVWSASPSGTISDWNVSTDDYGVWVNGSDDFRVEGVHMTARWSPLAVTNASATSVSNSTFDTSMGVALVLWGSGPATVTDSTFSGHLDSLRIIGSSARVSRVVVTADLQQALHIFAGDVQVEDVTVCGPTGGVHIEDAWTAQVRRVSFCPGSVGVVLANATGVLVEGLTFDGLTTAVLPYGGSNATLHANRFVNCTTVGVAGDPSVGPGMLVFENVFMCGDKSAADLTAAPASWYNATTRRGNYWDNYAGADADGDNIGDTPHPIPGGTKEDVYPLMTPYDLVPPLAVAPAPFTVEEDVAATLDGSNSTDNLGFLRGWWLVELPSGAVNVSGIASSFVFDTPGVYNVTLVVTDGWSRSWATTRVTVLDATAPAVSFPTDPVTINEDAPSTITVDATDNDDTFPDGATLWWVLTGRESLNWTGYGLATTLTLAEPGAYTLVVTVSDTAGNSASAAVGLVVRDVTPPSCTGSTQGTPGAGGKVTLGMTYQPDNDPAFPEQGALRWNITFPDGTRRTGTGATFTFDDDGPGPYTVGYSCADPSGNEATGTFTVTVADLDPPVWTPPPPLVVNDGAQATLSAENATDVSGIAGAEWSEGGEPLGSGVWLTAVWTGLGDHRVNVTIRDTAGNAATFTVLVRVVDGSAPTLANASWLDLREVRAGDPLLTDTEGAFSDNNPAFLAGMQIEWETDGPVGGWTVGSFNRSLTVVFTDVGNRTIRVTVTDPAGNSATFDLPVRVVRAGEPPGGGGGDEVPAGGLATELLVALLLLAGAGVAGLALWLRRRQAPGQPPQGPPAWPGGSGGPK